MLSLVVAVHTVFRGIRESSMQKAVITFIRKELSKSTTYGILAQRIIPSNAAFTSSPIVNSESDFQFKSLFSSDCIQILSLIPRPIVNLNGWTFYLDSEGALGGRKEPCMRSSEEFFLLIEADEISDAVAFISEHQKWWSKDENTIKLDSLCRRVAWHVGPPFRIVMACSRNSLEQVIDAYATDMLVTDDPLLIKSITVINTIGRPVELICPDSTTSDRSQQPYFSTLPNVVLFDATEGNSTSIVAIENILKRILSPNAYVLRHLTRAEWEAGAWCACTRLFICLCDEQNDGENMKKIVSELTREYCIAALLLLLPSREEFGETKMEMVDESWTEVELGQGALGRLLCLKDTAHLKTEPNLMELLDTLDIKCRKGSEENENIPDETPMIMYTGSNVSSKNIEYLCNLFERQGYRLMLPEEDYADVTKHMIFTWKAYQSDKRITSTFRFDLIALNQEEYKIPIVLLHADVVSSSWEIMNKIFNQLPINSGLVISSWQQTAGKGRGQNSWISTAGQLQMTFHCSSMLDSPLGRCPSIFQHIVALVLILTIEDISERLGCKDIGIRLKWPNDIYLIANGLLQKIGGILIRASVLGENINFVVGLGLNISNKKPTVCLHDVFISAGVDQCDLPSIELIMRRVLINVQSMIVNLESGKLTLERIRQQYEDRWLHSNQEVIVKQENNVSIRCRVIGIDTYGFLFVKDTQNPNETFSLHPDGNSFDHFHNLVRPK